MVDLRWSISLPGIDFRESESREIFGPPGAILPHEAIVTRVERMLLKATEEGGRLTVLPAPAIKERGLIDGLTGVGLSPGLRLRRGVEN